MGEATPDYLADPVAAALVSAVSPAARLIILVRDPKRRAHAAWDQTRRGGAEVRSFADAVEDELRDATRCRATALRLADDGAEATPEFKEAVKEYVERCMVYVDGSPSNCWMSRRYDAQPACKRYLVKGFFGPHIAVWLKFFAASQLLVVQAEELFRDSDGVASEVVRFLGLGGASGQGHRQQTHRRRRLTAKSTNCWHNCDSPKTRYENEATAAVERRLDDLYGPTNAILERLKGQLHWVGGGI